MWRGLGKLWQELMYTEGRESLQGVGGESCANLVPNRVRVVPAGSVRRFGGPAEFNRMNCASPSCDATGSMGSLKLIGEDRERNFLDEFLIKAFDIAGAGIGLIFLAPLLLVIACLIRIGSRGPILFRQLRIGRNGTLFTMLKFRTMLEGAEETRIQLSALNEQSAGLFKIREDPRLTRMGKFLRRASLDELPQLLNVLMGQMSLVGPRPLPLHDIEELDEDRYRFWLEERARVLPGITGLWQVKGRSELNTKEMAELDLHYIECRSLPMNFIILLKTIPAVVSGRGAY